jgi:hypothetical protein
VILSDGNYFASGILATQLNHKVNSGHICLFALLQVTEYSVSTMPPSGQRIIILFRTADSVQNPGYRLGNPVDVARVVNHPPSPLEATLQRNYLRSAYDAGAKMDELERAAKRLKSAVDDHQASLGEEIQKIDDEEKRLKDRLHKIDMKKQECAAENGIFDVSDDDLIEINAGGKVIAAKRGVLCQFKGTRLEALFSGRWEKKLLKDNKGRIFLDVNSDSFQAIIDWLNLLSISSEDDPPQSPSVDEEHRYILNHQMALFGHSPFPESPAKKSPVVDRFGDEVNMAMTEKWKHLQELEAGATFVEKNFKDEEQFINVFATGCTSDIITLNVSGTIMATKRDTLLAVEESMLAQQFDDTKWTEQGCKNEQVKEWTPDEVSNWTKNVKGMQEDVSGIFLENSINGSELLASDRDGLKDIGVKRVGTICLLLEEINTLKEKVNEDAVMLIEHSPYCFGKILDFLWLAHLNSVDLTGSPPLPSVSEHKKEMFEKVVSYYFPGKTSKLILGP